jgi:DNA-binding NarL/FixJ family response regulator
MGKINLTLATTCTIFAQGIRKILEHEEDVGRITEALNHQEILSIIECEKPDVLFIDTAVPNLNIIRILEKIRESGAPTKILLLLHTQDEEAVTNFICLGVRGVLRDVSNVEHFVRAIRAVSQEEIWAERRVLTKVITRLSLSSKIKLIPKHLTKKEREVVKLVSQGLSNRQVAKSLFIAEKTVKTHLGHIFKKVGVHCRSEITIGILQIIISLLLLPCDY